MYKHHASNAYVGALTALHVASAFLMLVTVGFTSLLIFAQSLMVAIVWAIAYPILMLVTDLVSGAAHTLICLVSGRTNLYANNKFLDVHSLVFVSGWRFVFCSIFAAAVYLPSHTDSSAVIVLSFPIGFIAFTMSFLVDLYGRQATTAVTYPGNTRYASDIPAECPRKKWQMMQHTTYTMMGV